MSAQFAGSQGQASLSEQVGHVFSSQGVLAQAVQAYLPRPQQLEMALAVARAIEERSALVVEAGTGVGKTFSYLVPALLCAERVMVSTATKALQDQLFGRDLPHLVQALGLPLRVALLKGRSNYLCLHRMQTARQELPASERGMAQVLGRVERWAQSTRTGDLAELPGLDERSALVPLITSTRDNCLGAQCPQLRSCHVNLARKEALAADVVVINHHLFFADLAVRESGMAELLPSVRVAVFDEAHQLNEIGIHFLGAQLSTAQLLELARDTLGAGLQHARGLVDWNTVCSRLERAARELRLCAGQQPVGTPLRWSGPAPQGLPEAQWEAALKGVVLACEAAAQEIATVTEIAPDFLRLGERAQEQSDRARRFLAAGEPDAVRWLEVGHQLRLVEAPLDIAAAMQSRLFNAQGEDAGRSFIFTSATLGAEPSLRWFTEPCGLQQAQVLQVGSPFDYARQAALYVPRGFPRPADVGHTEAVADLVVRSVDVLGGATLVLTTTLRALRGIARQLQAHYEGQADIEVLVQGEAPKRQLMERFREGRTPGRCGCVLVASATFWEGFDVPGDALQLVFIDKLPFPPPGDPLVEARLARLESSGRSGFADYSVPEAAIALKQGAGRLIRRESDRGVLVVCDVRLSSMGYGKRLLAALPPMAQIDETAYWERLQSLLAATKTATTAC